MGLKSQYDLETMVDRQAGDHEGYFGGVKRQHRKGQHGSGRYRLRERSIHFPSVTEP